MLRSVIYILILSVMVGAAFAEDIQWTGAAGDNKWENPGNWKEGRVPGANDDAWISSGMPLCVLPDRSVTVNRLTIEDKAEVKVGSSQINAQYFINEGKIDVATSLQVNPKDREGLLFENRGKINADNASLSFGVTNQNNYYSQVSIANSGKINGKTVNIQGTSFSNYDTTVGDKIFINVTGCVTTGRLSLISGKYHENSPGGSVWIFAEDLYIDRDFGLIEGGESINSQGGSVYIWLRGKFENYNIINAGSGKKIGNVYVIAKKIEERGRINSSGSLLAKATMKAVQGPGNVYILADSLDMGGELFGIWADSLIVRGRIVLVHDLQDYGTIDANVAKFNTTADGTIDFSGVNTSESITTGGTFANIFSNNIIEPAEVLNNIFDPDPNINPADTTIIDGSITSIYVSCTAGLSDSFRVNLHNQSTGSRVLSYNVSSTRGWIQSFTDSTVLLRPFDFADFLVEYTIPAGTVTGIVDSVMAILKIGTSILDTAFSTITCLGSAYSTLASIDVDPDSVTLRVGESQQFIANGYDAYGTEVAIEPIWTTTGGEINTSGLYSATEEGDFTVSAAVVGSSISSNAVVHVSGVIPVELASFRAYQCANSVLLCWETLSESNNFGFEVERSVNGVWQSIGFLAGNGTISHPVKYEFFDFIEYVPNSNSEIRYRLK